MANSKRPSRSDAIDLLAHIQLAIGAHAAQDARLCIGLSGGIDSVVLLDALTLLAPKHRWRLSCIHVHHGLSPNADSWLSFCRRVARSRGVAFAAERVSLDAQGSAGIEAAARRARYQVFARQPPDHIVLAHHQDDQAETVLLQLVRGSGITGLAAMPASRTMGPGEPTLLRPMLGLSRADIEVYAKRRRLKWIMDESNEDLHFARNFIRHELMPLLNQLNPQAPRNIARAAGLLGEAAELLAMLARVDLAAASQSGARLNVDLLRALGDPRARNALRQFFFDAGLGRHDSSRLDELWKQLCAARPDTRMRIELGGASLAQYRGELWLVPKQQPSVPAALAWNGRRSWALSGYGGAIEFRPAHGAGIAARFLRKGQVGVLVRQGGERLRLAADRPSRSLKNLFQEAGLPPWTRQRLPLLFIGERLAWVPSIGIDIAFHAAHGEPGVEPLWQPVTNSSNPEGNG